MTPTNAFKKWLPRKMAPYIESSGKKAPKTNNSPLGSENYSDLNEGTEYYS